MSEIAFLGFHNNVYTDHLGVRLTVHCARLFSITSVQLGKDSVSVIQNSGMSAIEEFPMSRRYNQTFVSFH